MALLSFLWNFAAVRKMCLLLVQGVDSWRLFHR